MKKLLVVLSFLCTVLVAKSQNLTVEGKSPNLYIVHTVAPKENFYSVGRLYNQAPKSIASFNNLVMEKGLTIGQHIKIPLNAQNFDVTGNANAGESPIPLTHLVAKSETLSKIGSDYNVAAKSLKQWNNLSSDNIAPGTPLVVGHLKMQSATGITKAGANTSSVINNQHVVARPEAITDTRQAVPEVKQAVPETKQAVTEPKKDEPLSSVAKTQAAEKTPETAAPDKKETAPSATQPTEQNKPVANAAAKDIPAQESVLKQETAKDVPVKDAPVVKESDAKETPVKEMSSKEAPVKETPFKEVATKSEEAGKVNSYSNAGNLGSIEGVFAAVYTTEASQKSLTTKSGDAATFKSTSGWQDKKYYVLMNDVTPGTILKIVTADNKAVFAKVLGSMPEMKENNGLLIRISSAAASYLGIIDPKFAVQISYYQ